MLCRVDYICFLVTILEAFTDYTKANTVLDVADRYIIFLRRTNVTKDY